MAGINDYTLSVILKAREEGMAAFAAMNAKLAELVVAAELANRALEKMDARGEQHSQILRMISGDTLRTVSATERMAETLETKLTPALRNSGNASGGARNGIIAFIQGMIPGGQTAGNIVIAITALALAFAPLTAELGASLVLLGAWVVGLAGFLGMVTVVAAPILAMAAAFGALGLAQMGGLDPVAQLDKANKALATSLDRTEAAQEAVRLAQLRYDAKPTAVNLQVLRDAQEQLTETQQKQVAAQDAVNTATANAAGPVSVFHEGLAKIGQELGQKAVPLVNQFATLLVAFLPTIDQAGNAVFKWFGDAFPLLMDIAQKAAFGLIDGLKQIAQAWVGIADAFLAHPVEFEKVFGTFFQLGVQAVIGLMKNLEALAFWFIDRFPVLEKNAESTFGNLGTAIQIIAHGLGAFVDWIILHWPEINHAFDETWKVVQQGWSQIAPVFSVFGDTLKALQPTLSDIQSHLYLFKPLLEIVVAVLLIVIATVYLVMLVLIALGAVLTVIAALITGFVDLIKARMPEAGAQFSALGTGVQTMGHDFGGVFFVIGQLLSNFGLNVHKEAVEGGAQFSALGTAAQTMQRDFGNVFSAIGTYLHQVGINIQVMVAQGGAQFDALGRNARVMQSDIGAAFSAIGGAANAMAGAVGSAFSGLGSAVHSGLVQVGNVFNTFGTAVNAALGTFGVNIHPVHYAEGGVVPGYAPGQDSVLAVLSPGEGVLTPQTVRAMGGETAIKALNQSGSSVAQMGAGGIGTIPGTWGGQCVVFAENLLGTYWPVAAAAQLTRYINSQTARTGEAAVFTGGPFGHVAVVTNPADGYNFDVIDSNWVGNEIIGMHRMNKAMYGFAGFIDTGKTLGTMAGLGIPGITSPAGLLDGLVTKALGGLGGWAGDFAKGVLKTEVSGILHSLGFDRGGQLPPGPSLIYNGTGRAENVTPGDTMDKVVDLLGQVVQEMRVLNGKGRAVNGMVAAGQFG